MEAERTYETSLNIYQTTQCNIPEYSHIHTRRRENLKSNRGYMKFTEPDRVTDECKSTCNLCDKTEQVWTCPKHEHANSGEQNLAKWRMSKWQTPPLSYPDLNTK
jgi:hypothetical protein